MDDGAKSIDLGAKVPSGACRENHPSLANPRLNWSDRKKIKFWRTEARKDTQVVLGGSSWTLCCWEPWMGGWWVRNDSISSARVSSEKLEQPWATREKKQKMGVSKGKEKEVAFYSMQARAVIWNSHFQPGPWRSLARWSGMVGRALVGKSLTAVFSPMARLTRVSSRQIRHRKYLLHWPSLDGSLPLSAGWPTKLRLFFFLLLLSSFPKWKAVRLVLKAWPLSSSTTIMSLVIQTWKKRKIRSLVTSPR